MANRVTLPENRWPGTCRKSWRLQAPAVVGLSAHADQRGLLEWFGHFEPKPQLALVHGEDKAREALAGEIGERDGIEVLLARPGMTVDA
jgi:metallo-beta-lactamase family protein